MKLRRGRKRQTILSLRKGERQPRTSWLVRWRQKQKVKRVVWLKTLAGWFLMVALSLAVIVLGLIGWRIFRESGWQGRGRCSWVMGCRDLSLWSLAEEPKQLIIITIPDEAEVEVAGGYGIFRAGGLVGLDTQEKQEGRLLRQSLQAYLGVGIDGFVLSDRFCSFTSGREAKQGAGGLLWQAILRGRKSGFNLVDGLRLIRKIGKLRADEVKLVALEEMGVLREARLPDGSLVWEENEAALDSWVKKLLVDREVVNEGWRVGVINATGYSGLARQMARILENTGFLVNVVADAERNVAESKLVVAEKSLLESHSVIKLKRNFGLKRIEVSQVNLERADILFWVGEDYASYLVID